jgi:hypothetical protein
MTDDNDINWAEIEARETTGLPIDPASTDVNVFKARVLDFNFRRAEGLCFTQQKDSLQLIRTLIARGNMAVLEDTISRMRTQDSTLEHNPEWRLEMARVAMLNGQWENGLSETNAVLNLQPTSITRMTTLQTSSIAHYELGDFAAAKRDIEYIRSMGLIYPRAQAHFYNEVLRIKILACEGQIENADHQLSQMWTRFLRDRQLNVNTALTLLRTETHIRRCAHQSLNRAAYASLLLCELMGDDLYAALARLELYLAGDAPSRLADVIENDRRRFAKVDLLLNEIESGAATSTTAKNLGQSKKENSSLFHCPHSSFTMIAIPKHQVLLQLEPFAAHQLEIGTRPSQTLMAILEQERPTKQSVFEDVFGQKYVSHLHDRLLHMTLSRARVKWPVSLDVTSGGIAKPAIFLV